MLHGSENIELVAGWNKRLQYNPYDPKPQFVEFSFKVVKSGEHNSLDVNFYYKQCLLKTLHFDFIAVVKQSQPLVVGSEE